MPEFAYIAVDPKGKEKRGTVKATTDADARAADYLEREFDNFTATALSMLEPAIIVVMGAIVTTIVLAILLPILQLEKLVGG